MMSNSFSVIEMLENPQHSTKKDLRPYGSVPKKRPPKLNTKKNFHRRLFSSQMVNLLDVDDENKYISHIYDESLDVSYFDQCFDTIAKIGEGSFGEVYKVRSKDDGKLYAIKKSKECYRGQSDRKEKVAEVRKYERIPRHENIINLFNAWEQDEHVYLQMELGVISLEQFAEEHHDIPEKQLWNILLDMLLALKNLHDCSLLHMDIKLENIILCENGSCKLGDFGLLTDLKGDLKNVSEGDAKYLAAEVMSGTITKAADVFSLGISMLELASDLELPVYGKLWQELRNGIYPVGIVNRIPTELMNIIRRMMNKDPKKRPSVKSLLKHPRMRSMLKQRRNAVQSRIDTSFSPSIMRTSTPIPGTPSNNGMYDASRPLADVRNAISAAEYSTPNLDLHLSTFESATQMPTTPPNGGGNPLIELTQATPPTGYSTPDMSFLLSSFEASNYSVENNVYEEKSGAVTDVRKMYETPQFRSSDSFSFSVKRLDFWEEG